MNTGDQGIVNDVNNGRVADLTGTDGRKTGRGSTTEPVVDEGGPEGEQKPM